MSEIHQYPHGRELSLPGLTGEIRAVQFGNPEGRPLLALHGWLDNAASFLPLADELADCNVVALDFPGHGRSAHRPTGVPYHLTDYVLDVAMVVGALEWSNFIMMGHSLGAGVAMMFTASRPSVVSELVLIDGLAPISGSIEDTPGRLARSIDAVLSRSTPAPRAFASWGELTAARMRAGRLSLQNAVLLVGRAARECDDGRVQLCSDRRLKEPSAMYLQESQALALIRAVSRPALLILAEGGEVIRRTETAERIAAFDELMVRKLDGHHHLHMDNPCEVGACIREFLLESPATAAVAAETPPQPPK